MEFEVWFAVDHRTSECGSVAASSLLAHRPRGSRTILRVAYVFGEPAPATWWPILLKKAAPEREIDFSQVPIDVGAFSNCKALFDSRAAFLRLLIPLHAHKNRVVYSDADVVFQENIENLVFETNAGVNGLALIKAGKCANQPEREQALMREHGKAPDDDYYFSGLAVLDLQKYNEHRLVQKSEEIARNSSSKLDFHDQTIWNCVAKEIESIDGRWCHLAYPGILLQYPPKSFIRGLIHFVGSPKPWDLLGEIYHPYSQIWVDAAKKAGLLFPRIRKYFQLYSWQRAWRIRKQYSVWKSQQNKK